MKKICLFVLLLNLWACASTPPATAITQPPLNNISLAEVMNDHTRFVQSPVRWGGRILNITAIATAGGEQLALEILEYPLDAQGSPLTQATSGGRFIARIQPPYRAKEYSRNRSVTLVGRLIGTEIYPLATGDSQRLPVVEVQEQYSWRREDPAHHHSLWPRFFYQIGFRKNNVGIGVVLH
ncbi:MAG: Slp family lipoprotein [Cellvibrionaceae bacterium]|nr:Slp family lipoprotein [Cellvibrionaceae bacterium]